MNGNNIGDIGHETFPHPNQIREALERALSGMGINLEVVMPQFDDAPEGGFPDFDLSEDFPTESPEKDGEGETPESQGFTLLVDQDKTIKDQRRMIKELKKTGDRMFSQADELIKAQQDKIKQQHRLLISAEPVLTKAQASIEAQAKVIKDQGSRIEVLEDQLNQQKMTRRELEARLLDLQHPIELAADREALPQPAVFAAQLDGEYNRGWNGAITGLIEQAGVQYNPDSMFSVAQVVEKIGEFRK